MALNESSGPLTLRRLVVVRQLYQQGVLLSHSNTTSNRILAVITFDTSVETALDAFLTQESSDNAAEKAFPAKVNSAKARSQEPLQYVREIWRLHDIRNDAQHKAKFPTSDEVEECRQHAKEFLTALCHQQWGLAFESISLAGLVEDEIARRYLELAELALTERNWLQAAQQANAALTWALRRVRGVLMNDLMVIQIGESHHWSDQIDYYQYGFDESTREQRKTIEFILGRLGTLQKQLKEYLGLLDYDVRRTKEAVIVTTVGISLVQYLRFQRLAGRVRFRNNSPEEPIFSDPQQEITQRQAEMAVSFCTDAILRVEAAAGSLDEPFSYRD